MFGKVITYDESRNTAIVYGSTYVRDSNYKWNHINSQKYTRVIPQTNQAKTILIDNIEKTVSIEGSLSSWIGQSDEIFMAYRVTPQAYVIETPTWYGFGKTIRPERIYKTNLNNITDFVDRLAPLADVLNTRNNSNKTVNADDDMVAIRKVFRENWDLKWAVAKDLSTQNEQIKGVGGWQFYQGYLGRDNCYIETSPVTRKNIDVFMDAVRPGGGSPEKSGPAIMYAYTTIERDRYGNIQKAFVSGALYDSLPGFLKALEKPTTLNKETWELRGWDEETIKTMEKNPCWISGSRVLVYDEEGALIDQYYALRNCLTKEEFNQTLNKSRDLIGQGGM